MVSYYKISKSKTKVGEKDEKQLLSSLSSSSIVFIYLLPDAFFFRKSLLNVFFFQFDSGLLTKTHFQQKKMIWTCSGKQFWTLQKYHQTTKIRTVLKTWTPSLQILRPSTINEIFTFLVGKCAGLVWNCYQLNKYKCYKCYKGVLSFWVIFS